jgi:hypothetical protein
MLKYGSQLNLPEESPMEHSSQSQGCSQRSEETVEANPLSGTKSFSPISESKYHKNEKINKHHDVRNVKTVLFSDEKKEKMKVTRKNSPQSISSNFLKYFMNCEKEEKCCTEEMKVTEEIEYNYLEIATKNHLWNKRTKMKSEEELNIQTHICKVENSSLYHRKTISVTKTVKESINVHKKIVLQSPIKDRNRLRKSSRAGVLSSSRKPDRTATLYDKNSSDTCSTSFASDFMC